MEAAKVEDVSQMQEVLWTGKPGLEDAAVAELLDRLTSKAGAHVDPPLYACGTILAGTFF